MSKRNFDALSDTPTPSNNEGREVKEVEDIIFDPQSSLSWMNMDEARRIAIIESQAYKEYMDKLMRKCPNSDKWCPPNPKFYKELMDVKRHFDSGVPIPPRVEEKKDEQLWAKYLKEIKDSEGFDIDHYPGPYEGAYVRPQQPRRGYFSMLYSKMAVEKYNNEMSTDYELEQVDKVNVTYDCWPSKLFITFRVRDGRGESYSVETWQAEVVICSGPHASPDPYVSFVRRKPQSGKTKGSMA